MATVNTYITYDGNCEEAFNFYKSVFGGEFSYFGKFKDMPPMDGKSLSARRCRKNNACVLTHQQRNGNNGK